jgi:hypothetical protein
MLTSNCPSYRKEITVTESDREKKALRKTVGYLRQQIAREHYGRKFQDY